jgi:hypothetical protein
LVDANTACNPPIAHSAYRVHRHLNRLRSAITAELSNRKRVSTHALANEFAIGCLPSATDETPPVPHLIAFGTQKHEAHKSDCESNAPLLHHHHLTCLKCEFECSIGIMKLAFLDFSTCERSTTTVGYAEAHDVPNFTPTEVTEMGTPRVSCDFESGNACAIDLELSGEVWHVRFASDPHGGTETLWFYFRVDGDKDDRFRLTLVNAETCLGGRGDWSNAHPVIRHLPTKEWQRCDGGRVSKLQDGRFEVSWEVRALTGSFEFAFCYPYTRENLMETLEACCGYWHCDVIGVTSKGRKLLRLSNSYGEEGSIGVYIIARQHSGETPASWVLDGLLRSAIEKVSPNEMTIWVVPFANLDGVVDGDYGKDPFPYDMNRAWLSPLPMRHEVAVIQADIERFSKRCRLAIAIDMHAPGALEADGAYFQLLKPTPSEANSAMRFVEVASEHLPKEMMHEQPFRVARYSSRWDERGTFSRWMWDSFAVPALVFEVPYSKSRGTLLTIEHYRALGSGLLEGLIEWAKRFWC